MTITVVQAGGTLSDNAASGARAFASNVTSGNKAVIACFRSAGASDPFVAGDCTKTAGTSTIGTVELLEQREIQYEAHAGRMIVGLWAVDVTGTGSLTMTVAGAANNYFGVAGIELNASAGWDAGYLEDTAPNSTASDNTNGSTGNAVSAGAAIFIGVLSTSNDGGAPQPMTLTEDGAFTLAFEEGDESAHAAGSVIYRIVSTGTTDSADWTISGNLGWACALAVLKEAAGATAALTGTATASITEADIVAGGKTIVVTLTGETFVPAAGFQTIQYVGGQGAGFAGTTSPQTITFALTGGLASTPAAGDLVVITYFVGSTVARSQAIRNTSAVDYTLVADLTQSDTFDANQRTAYRFMPGTPETQFVLTETVGGGTGSLSDAGRYTVHVFRGVDAATPQDVAAVTGGAIDSSAVNPGAITPVTAGAWIYAAGGAASGTGSTMTSSNLTDFRAGSTADTNDASIGAGYGVWSGSGAFDPAAYGNIPGGTTANSWTSVTMALRPAATTPFADARAAMRDGLVSAQSEAAGFNARRSTIIPLANIARTSDTVCTITFAADAGYDITAQEVITDTIPGSILTGGSPIVATPTFTIDPTGAAQERRVPPRNISQAVNRASSY